MCLRNRPPPKYSSTASFTAPKNSKDAGIIRCRKESTKRLYSIVDQRIFNVVDALTPGLLSILTKEAVENVVYE